MITLEIVINSSHGAQHFCILRVTISCRYALSRLVQCLVLSCVQYMQLLFLTSFIAQSRRLQSTRRRDSLQCTTLYDLSNVVCYQSNMSSWSRCEPLFTQTTMARLTDRVNG